MGCDIHLMVEKRDIDGKWVSVDVPQKDAFHLSGNRYNWFGCRNYMIFAALADVRNGWGFEWDDDDDLISPISSPKGIPSDCSSDYREFCQRWNGIGYHHSYVTLKELLDYDWDQKLVFQGKVNFSGYAEFMETGKPSCWLNRIFSDTTVLHISTEEMKRLYDKYPKSNFDALFTREEIEGVGIPFMERLSDVPAHQKQLDDSYNVYTEIKWSDILRNHCDFAVDDLIPELKSLSESEDFEDVRIVFFFDN